MYKKFSSHQLLGDKAFDPLNYENYTPDMCGYGVRNIRLDPTLSYIEIRPTLKSAIEWTVQVEDFIKPILPHTTMDIIKFQHNFATSDKS